MKWVNFNVFGDKIYLSIVCISLKNTYFQAWKGLFQHCGFSEGSDLRFERYATRLGSRRTRLEESLKNN